MQYANVLPNDETRKAVSVFFACSDRGTRSCKNNILVNSPNIGVGGFFILKKCRSKIECQLTKDNWMVKVLQNRQ